ncbi:Na+/melibiose symporter-like transporter [Xenococcus sp. PCC 7305]|uniref:MFS transporter n=1 Tax=Xenococcus sp. PCC 7305 TaxID=102125 RepID=UPI0002AC3E4B|nr:MFS transporter [Xenococcus sp. PCC 7305]ELS01329.1 Na+/melibiose symporter-like transporter [Xenococcus sp. PCC 7305]
MKTEKLNFTTKLAYGSGDMGPAITANVLVFFLLYFCTNVAGLPAGMAGSILAIGKISDAINDPIIGVLSDRTRTKWGRRIPWMLCGMIPFGLCFFCLWLVPSFSSDTNVNNWCLFTYYVVIAILFHLSYTSVNLPYTTLTPELTQDYNERTNLNSFRFAFSIGGSILSLVLASFIFQAYPDNPRQQYFVLASVVAILAMVALLWCALRIQERGAEPVLNQKHKKNLGYLLIVIAAISLVYGIANSFTNPVNGVLGLLLGLQLLGFGYSLVFAKTESHLCDRDAIDHRNSANATPSLPIIDQIKIALQNKPFRYVIGIYLCSWLAVQLTASILIYFTVSYMGMPEADFPKTAIAVQGTALVMLFFWKFVSSKIGKKAVYFIGTSFWILAQIGLFLIQPGQITELYILAVLAGFGVSVAYLIPWSMIPDVIELDELNTGQRREGIFYSFMVLLQKFGLAFAVFLVGIALQLSGFVERIPGEAIPQQPESALFAIRCAIAPLPTITLIIGVILAYLYPITKEFHEEIRLKLQEKNRNI